MDSTRTLRVTTFNLLHDRIRNFAAGWSERRPAARALIRSLAPDVLCLQEVSPRQLVDVERDLEEYVVIAGAQTGPVRLPRWAFAFEPFSRFMQGDYFDEGELSPILLRRESVRGGEHGSIRLNATPDHPPISIVPHGATWVRVEVGGIACTVFNTHLGLLPTVAAVAAADLRARVLLERGSAIVTGDLNATPGGPVMRVLLERGTSGADTLHDTWVAAEAREGSGRTFDWGFGLPGARLDYILTRPQLRVRRALTTASTGGGPRPSDHLALTVEIEVAE